MPLRLSFFDDPLLRLTQPHGLNDPFDAKPSEIAIDKKMAFFADAYGADMTPQKLEDCYRKDLENGLDDFGIISLTENPYNLLMWSHYADEHKGMVISLVCDEHTFSFHNSFTTQCGISKIKPQRVIYSNRRPGFEMPDDAIYEYFEHNFFSHIAMTKGDDWIYEKEHRYLLKMSEVDAAIFNVLNLEELSKLSGEDIKLTKIGNQLYKAEIQDEQKDYLPWWLAFAQGRRYIENIMSFKRINSRALSGVYLGCKVSDEIVQQVKSAITKSIHFDSSTPIYRSTTSQNRFEIGFEFMGLASST